MRIDLGSGKYPHAGCISVDIEPSNHPDIVGDFRTMEFKDLEEIKAYQKRIKKASHLSACFDCFLDCFAHVFRQGP